MKSYTIALKIVLPVFLSLLAIQSRAADAPPPALEVAARSYLLEDFHSGQVLAESNADQRLAPASLTKIMAVYVVFRELKNGNLNLDDNVTISENAWRTEGSRMFVEVNKKVSVEQLLKGVIIQSGNDASVALAERVAGDEATFAQLMNQHAARLGMTNSHFTNSMGLPDESHYTTARDLAAVTRALIKEFPEYYPWHSIKEYAYNNIKQHNRNKLLWRDETVDGVKTGHTEEAGFCLVASALRDDMRLISVVMGASSDNARTNANQTLLNYGYRFFETHRLYKANEALTKAKVWKGGLSEIGLGVSEDLYVTIPRRRYKDLKATIDLNGQLIAPVNQGQSFGSVNVALGETIIVRQPVVALQAVEEGNIFRRLYDGAMLRLQ